MLKICCDTVGIRKLEMTERKYKNTMRNITKEYSWTKVERLGKNSRRIKVQMSIKYYKDVEMQEIRG